MKRMIEWSLFDYFANGKTDLYWWTINGYLDYYPYRIKETKLKDNKIREEKRLKSKIKVIELTPENYATIYQVPLLYFLDEKIPVKDKYSKLLLPAKLLKTFTYMPSFDVMFKKVKDFSKDDIEYVVNLLRVNHKYVHRRRSKIDMSSDKTLADYFNAWNRRNFSGEVVRWYYAF